MTASLSGVFSLQELTDLGTPLVGGRVYTCTQGTTTHKTAYTDKDGSIAHTYTSDGVGGQYIGLNARGELPAPLYLAAGSYDITLKDSTGATIWTRRADPVDDSASAIRADLASTSDASKGAVMVGVYKTGIGEVDTTAQDLLIANAVNAKRFGLIGDGSNEYTKLLALWTHCLLTGKNLYFPAGTYSSGINNMPFKNTDYPATTLLDCKNITIFGDGPNTVLRSDSAVGADVLNLYSVKNLHVRNMKVTASLSGTSGAGSNGISIVGGFDNLTFDHIWFENLPYVDKASYLDGGKAFTIQPGTPATECGTVQGRNLYAKGCVYGVGLEVDLVNWGAKKHAIDVDIVAEDCHIGIIFSAGAAASALSSSMTMGYRVRGRLVNCQRNVVLGRAHGVDIEANIITTKAAASRRLNPSGGTWNSVDAVVDGLLAQYAKNSRLVVYGDLGGCDYKAQIGGATAGSSGLTGATDNCQIYIDLGGTAATADINAINSGGDIASNTVLYVSSTTTSAAIPSGLYTPSYNNTITKGPSQRVMDMTVGGTLSFASSDGVTSYATIKQVSNEITMQQTAASGGGAKVLRMLNHLGALQFAVRNDGSLVSQGRGTATAVSTVKEVLPIYDNTDTLVGYVPIYTGYTP